MIYIYEKIKDYFAVILFLAWKLLVIPSRYNLLLVFCIYRIKNCNKNIIRETNYTIWPGISDPF